MKDPERAGYRIVGGRELRKGYTTGSCAAAASAAAAYMAVSGKQADEAAITLPAGERVVFEIANASIFAEGARCSVKKDGGDDPDVTTGLDIFAEVTLSDNGVIEIDGGDGVGRVTKEGLQIPPGKPAINPVPRRMIAKSVQEVFDSFSFGGGAKVTISVPGGEAVAKRTFNPMLGITGGISIIGTTGIVEPMSEDAIVATTNILIDRRFIEDPEKILITPGNYGSDFCRDHLKLDLKQAVQVSNYVGEALDYIRYKGFRKVLFVGHTGKLIKTAASIMNTHSGYADGRMEIIAAYAAANGADTRVVRDILGCITTDKAFDVIRGSSFESAVKKEITDKALFHLRRRLGEQAELELVMFTTDRDSIMRSDGAETLIAEFRTV